MKGIILLCGLFAVSFALSLTGLFSVSSASAQSYQPEFTDKLVYGRTGASEQCDLKDITSSWVTEFDNMDKTPRAQELFDDLKSIFSSDSSDSNWIITQRTETYSGVTTYYPVILFSEKPMTLYWPPEYPYFSARTDTGTAKALYISKERGCNYLLREMNDYDIVHEPYATYTTSAILLANVKNPNYPANYTGPLIPDTFTPPLDESLSFSYSIVDKMVKLKNTTPKDLIPDGSVCTFVLDQNPDQASDTDLSEIIYELPDCYDEVTHTYDKYGHYTLMLTVQLPDDPNIYTVDNAFWINGGTESGSVDSDGIKQDSIYEECTVADIGCHFRNFQVWLGVFFRTLFTPSPSALTRFSKLGDTIVSKFGFISQSISVAEGFFSQVTSALNGNINVCNFNYGKFFGADYKHNFCSFEQQFPTAYNTVRYFIIGLTCYVLVAAGFTAYKRLIA